MAAPNVTYNISNGEAGDASKVMTNFNDLINGLSDGTKALTVATIASTLGQNFALPTALPASDVLMHSSSSGQLSLSNAISGVTDASSAAAGKVGQVISANSAGVTFAASGSFVNIASISLTAGDWDVEGMLAADTTSGTTVTRINGGISLSTGTIDATNLGGYVNMNYAVGTANAQYIPIGKRIINVSTTTTVYLVGRSTYAVLGSMQWTTDSYIVARRIR